MRHRTSIQIGSPASTRYRGSRMRWTCSLREMEVRAFINNGANASLGNPKVSKRKAGRNTCLRTIEMPQRFFSSLHDSQDFQPSARSKEKLILIEIIPAPWRAVETFF